MLSTFVRMLFIGVFALGFAMISAANADEAQAETGLASWYGPGFAGNPTASGETYDPYGYTAAHKTLPLGTELVVSYGGRTVNVVVNDRGPYVGDRVLDLSQGAASYLGLDRAGVDYVDYQIVGAGYSEPATPEVDASQTATSSNEVSSDTTDTTSSGGAYTVQSGDTLYDIAAQLGTSADALAASNGIYDANLIVEGQTLHY